MKARAIDKYIRQATAGLPHLERIDTAAEIRVNLNLRIKELMLEGHPKEEAEFLAIKDMGDVFTTNRALLGHAFTHRLGWVLVGATVLGLSGWLLWQHRWDYFWGETSIKEVPLSTADMEQSFSFDKNFNERGNYQKFVLNLPRGTRGTEVIMVTPQKSYWSVLSEFGRTSSTRADIDSLQNPVQVGLLLGTGINVNPAHKSEAHRVYVSWQEQHWAKQPIINTEDYTRMLPTYFPSGSPQIMTWSILEAKKGVLNNPNYVGGVNTLVFHQRRPAQQMLLNKCCLTNGFCYKTLSS